MPGLLKRDAKCPECGAAICASFRTSNAVGTVYEYCHTATWRRGRKAGVSSCKARVPKQDEAGYEFAVYRPLHVARLARVH